MGRACQPLHSTCTNLLGGLQVSLSARERLGIAYHILGQGHLDLRQSEFNSTIYRTAGERERVKSRSNLTKKKGKKKKKKVSYLFHFACSFASGTQHGGTGHFWVWKILWPLCSCHPCVLWHGEPIVGSSENSVWLWLKYGCVFKNVILVALMRVSVQCLAVWEYTLLVLSNLSNLCDSC